MHPDSVTGIALALFIAILFGTLIFKAVKYGGLRAAMFGAPIVRTVGEVPCARVPGGTVSLRVHVLGGDDPDKAIGLEFVAKSMMSYQMIPMAFSTADAAQLVEFIQAARAERPA